VDFRFTKYVHICKPKATSSNERGKGRNEDSAIGEAIKSFSGQEVFLRKLVLQSTMIEVLARA
jgi:hypothetical protein